MRARQTFTREFKLEAVRLLEEGKKPVADLARELGVRRNQLYKWKEQIEKRTPMGKESAAGEIARLKKELAQVKEENEILKKAAAFFARELK